MQHVNNLTLTWSTSRGQESFGYNIARLDSYASGKRYRTCGGGYDMTGTVVGHWLEAEHQAALQRLFSDNAKALQPYATTMRVLPNFYGAFLREDGTVYLDGGCGESCMWAIAEAIGLTRERHYNRKGHTTGYVVYAKEGA
jgi:hypothetical protein